MKSGYQSLLAITSNKEDLNNGNFLIRDRL